MDIFDPTRKRGTLRPNRPKRKQKLKKQTARKSRSRRPKPTTLRPNAPQEEMPTTARWRRFRRDFGGVIRSLTNVRLFLSSARFYSFLLLVGCLYALYIVGTNERFYLNNVSVDGVKALSAMEILDASGLRGAHIFSIAPGQAAEIIGALPGVITAEVIVNWPDNVQIIIEEDTPILLWNEDGRDYWVTKSGTLVPVYNQTFDLLKVNAVVPLTIQEPNLTQRPETDLSPILPTTYLDFVPQEILNGALKLQELYPYITNMEFAPSGGLRFNDERGWLATFGTGENLLRKHTVYETIANHVQGEEIAIEYINVSVLENPVYKPANAVVSGQ